MIDSKRKYEKVGIQSLPTQDNKAPKSGVNWKNDISESEFKGAFGIGLKCGSVSNGLECLDFDNHFGNAFDICQDFLSDDYINQMLGTKLFIASTTSGGYHLVFFSDHYEGNQKLARENHGGIVKTVIETRGEGGYFCAEPTAGYEWSKHSLLKCEQPIKLTREERDYLISTAKTFNKFVPETQFESNGTGIRVGDLYNQDFESKYEALEILKSHGWTANGKRLTRPGKSEKDGISATFGHVADNILYVFSSNAHPFDENRAYTPFQIKALLEHNGNFKECVKALAPRYDSQIEVLKEEKKESEFDSLLSGLRIDLSTRLEKPKTILSVVEESSEVIPILHLGDFSVLTGKQKSKKTFLTSVITATLAGSTKHNNKLSSEYHDGKKRIVYFDTEQGEYYAQWTAKRISSEISDTQYFDYFGLRELDHYKRREVIEYYLQKNPDVLFAAIDGIVDLLYDFNSQEESAKLIQWLMTITKKYNVHILNIIHQNKADGHARGHLGTMISQKAETILEIEKSQNNDGSSIIRPKDVRGREFEPFKIMIDAMGNPHLDEAPEESGIF